MKQIIGLFTFYLIITFLFSYIIWNGIAYAFDFTHLVFLDALIYSLITSIIATFITYER